MPLPDIHPPLVNSANPWATTRDDLQRLFECAYTGAVTTRTTLVNGFPHNDEIHQYTFFDPLSHKKRPDDIVDGYVNQHFNSSLNTLGYSPIRLHEYLQMIPTIVADSSLPDSVRYGKPFIVSVTGTAEEVLQSYEMIKESARELFNPLCMEINLSCPNIPDKPPPAYSSTELAAYLKLLRAPAGATSEHKVFVGIKTPPYTYLGQFKDLITALEESCDPECPVDFVTATNTLGSSLLLGDTQGNPAIGSATGAGIGGLAGSAIHPLALGNVKTLRGLLDASPPLKHIMIIGVGGVGDTASYERMQAVGAGVVGVGTALGREGVPVFERILNGGST